MLIIDRLRAWALTALAVLFVLLGAYAYGGRVARKAADKKNEYDDARRAAAGAKGAHDAAVETSKLPDGGAADQLRNEWVRGAPGKDDDA